MDELDSLVQAKIDGDQGFQASLASLSEDDKAKALADKKKEVLNSEWKAIQTKAAKDAELATNYKTRAEKAEEKLKKKGGGEGGGHEDDKPTDPGLSPTDLYALMDNNIPQEDVEEVQKAAKLLGKSIPDALKDSMVQSILKDRAEVRRTADATKIKPGRPGNKTPSDDELRKELSEGKIPKRGTPEAEQLFWARRGRKAK